MDLLGIPNTIGLIVWLVLAGVKIFALITALMFSAEAYRAADKWTKPGWVIVLALAIALPFVLPIFFINLGLTVAALVFLADVRPALAGLRRR